MKISTAFTARLRGGRAWIQQVLAAALTICGCFTGCNSNGRTQLAEPPEVIVEPDQKLPMSPHLFDVYRATNADKAIVFLHGAMGAKHFFAYQLGLNLSSRDNDYSAVNEQLLLANKFLAIFPQGQAIPEAPLAFTWDNYVMTSGHDDMQFIRDLVSHISSQYGITIFYIVGHSSGGMMANRIWCEEPDLFEGYVAIAGPPSERFLTPESSCSPAHVKPYMGIVGSNDNVLQVAGNWGSSTWDINPALLLAGLDAVVDPIIIGERYFLPSRVSQRCGETVREGDADAITEGAVTTWSFCGNSIKLVRIESGKHTLESLQSASGMSVLDSVFNF